MRGKKNQIISLLILNLMGLEIIKFEKTCIASIISKHKIFQFLTNFILV